MTAGGTDSVIASCEKDTVRVLDYEKKTVVCVIWCDTAGKLRYFDQLQCVGRGGKSEVVYPTSRIVVERILLPRLQYFRPLRFTFLRSAQCPQPKGIFTKPDTRRRRLCAATSSIVVTL